MNKNSIEIFLFQNYFELNLETTSPKESFVNCFCIKIISYDRNVSSLCRKTFDGRSVSNFCPGQPPAAQMLHCSPEKVSANPADSLCHGLSFQTLEFGTILKIS